MPEIFISYPRASRTKVEPIKNRLAALGFDLYFDIHNIDGGEDFPAEIDREVKNAKVVLAFWTAAAFSRRWCMQECRIGLLRRVLLPVKLEPFDDLDVPVEFGGVNYFDLSDWDESDEHDGWRQLVDSLRRRLQDGPDAAPTPIRTAIPQAAHDARWALLQDSLDWREYEDFYAEFPRAPQRAEARVRQRLLQDWDTAEKSDLRAVADFRTKLGQARARGALGAFAALDNEISRAFQRAVQRPAAFASAEVRAERRQAAWPVAAGAAAMVLTVITAGILIRADQDRPYRPIDDPHYQAEAPIDPTYGAGGTLNPTEPESVDCPTLRDARVITVVALDSYANEAVIQDAVRDIAARAQVGQVFTDRSGSLVACLSDDQQESRQQRTEVLSRTLSGIARYGGGEGSDVIGFANYVTNALVVDAPSGRQVRLALVQPMVQRGQNFTMTPGADLWGELEASEAMPAPGSLRGLALEVHLLPNDAIPPEDLRAFWTRYAEHTGATITFR